MNPVVREGYKFRQEICIPCYQTDQDARLRPAAFMDMAQEIAYWAASELGFGYDTLHIHHHAWVLTRMHVHFGHSLRWRDPAVLYTWHKGSEGPFYLRDFELMGPDGKPAVQATSSWVVMDEQTRRLVRPEQLREQLHLDYEVGSAIEAPAPKLPPPPSLTPTLQPAQRVVYSDLDILGHTNNVRYAVWAMDCLPLELARRPMKDLYINFNKETTFGDTVQLQSLETEDSFWVEGAVDGKSCFVVRMDF